MNFWAKSASEKASEKGKYKDVFQAATEGNFSAVSSFVQGPRPVELGARNSKNETIAHLSALHGHLEIVQWCVQRNETFFIRTVDSSGNSIMHAAVKGGSLAVVQYLSSKKGTFLKTHPNLHGDTVLHEAALRGHLNMVKFFVDEWQMDCGEVRRNFAGETAAHVAARYNQYPVLSYLLSTPRPYLNASDNTDYRLLHWAATTGNVNAVRELCKIHRVSAEVVSKVTGQSPIHLAVHSGFLDATKTLIDECHANLMLTRTTYPRDTSLHIAAAAGNVHLLKYFRSIGFSDFDVKNESGQTPIIAATVNNRLRSVRYLIETGVDAKIRDNNGNTILHVAAVHRNLRIVEYLLDERGMDLPLDAKNNIGQTSVYVASLHGNLAFIRYVVDSKQARHVLDVPASNGRTPLMEAALRDDLTMVEYSVKNGCGLSWSGVIDKTELDLGVSDRVKYFLYMESVEPSYSITSFRERRMVRTDSPFLSDSTESAFTPSNQGCSDPPGLTKNYPLPYKFEQAKKEKKKVDPPENKKNKGKIGPPKTNTK